MSDAVYTYIHFRTPSKTSTNQTPEGVHLPSDSVSRVAIARWECQQGGSLAQCPLRVWAGWQFCPVRVLAGWQFCPLRMLAGWQFCPLRVWAGWQSISHPFLVSELVEVFPATHRRWLNIIRRGEILLPPNSGHLGFELSGIPQNTPFCVFQVIWKKNITRIVSIFQYYKMSKELSTGCSSQDILVVGWWFVRLTNAWERNFEPIGTFQS